MADGGEDGDCDDDEGEGDDGVNAHPPLGDVVSNEAAAAAAPKDEAIPSATEGWDTPVGVTVSLSVGCVP